MPLLFSNKNKYLVTFAKLGGTKMVQTNTKTKQFGTT